MEELESWLEPVEVELSTPTRDRDPPGLEELLGAQGEREAAVGQQARRVPALLGRAQAFAQEGRCLALLLPAPQLVFPGLPMPLVRGTA